MEENRILKFDCINKVKIEKSNEFKQSIFENVYEKANNIASRIIHENCKENADYNITDSSYLDGEKFNNIIPFLGERGMGKSSAMLSFAFYLKDYSHGASGQMRLKIAENQNVPVFYPLPRIDIAMLVKGENLLDIILANMWMRFYKKIEQKVSFDPVAEETKKKFEEVKMSYELFRKSISGIETEGMTSVRELKELSKCINLRESFKGLVESYLDYMMKHDTRKGEAFLLITLDDLDVATQDVYGVLEQIRLFLMIPKVIVLVSADLERLFLECNKYFADKLLPVNCSFKYDEVQIRDCSRKYLSKIFPDNMRIFLPATNTEEYGEYKIEVENGVLLQTEYFSAKDVIYGLIERYTGIMMYPAGRMNHVLYKASLREVVNNLYMLMELEKQSEKIRFKEASSWIAMNLEAYCNNMTDYEKKQRLKNVMELNDVNVEDTITYSLPLLLGNTRDRSKQKWDRRDRYSNLINYLSDLQEIEDSILFECVLLLFSNHIVKCKNAKQNKRRFEELYGKHIFKRILREIKREEKNNANEPAEGTKEDVQIDMAIPSNLFKVTLKWKEGDDIVQCFQENAEQIYNIVCLALLSDSNFADDYGMYNISRNSQNETILECNRGYYMFSLDALLNNLVNFEEIIKGICINLYSKLMNKEITHDFEEKNSTEIQKLMNIEGFHLKDYMDWKEKNHIQSLANVLPVESMEVMLKIAEKIKNIPSVQKTGNTANVAVRTLQRQIQGIEEELRNVEKKYKAMGKGYCAALEQILNTFQIFDVVCAMTQEIESSDGLDTIVSTAKPNEQTVIKEN